MKRRINTIIFDFDYTLADSSNGVVECVNFALGRLGYQTASREAVCRIIGLSLAEAFSSLTGQDNPAHGGEFADLFTQRADEVMTASTSLIEGVAPTLGELRSRGIQLGIVSTKFRYRIEEILARDRLLDVFDAVVGGEDVSKHKPDPEGLIRARELLGSPLSQVLYVGDTEVDAETAARAGTAFLAVLSGVTPREAFGTYPVAGIIETLSELPAWLVIT
jgi:phosphoglycolate phosphatase